MAWTTPRTWVSGESVTASMLNTHVRDNFLSFGRWTDYLPTWTSNGVGPGIGNGRIAGRYAKAGRTVAISFLLQFNNATAAGTGQYFFGLPHATRSGLAPGQDSLLGWFYGENQALTAYSFWPRYRSTTTFELVYDAAAGSSTLSAVVGQTLPFVWGTGDYIEGYLIYESLT